MKSVAVFFGGQSIEHEISVITGALTLNSLDKTLYNPIPIYVDKDGKWYTGESLFDIDSYKNLEVKKLKRVTLLFGDNKLYKIKGKKITPFCEIAFIINCMHGERGEDGSLAGIARANNLAFASPDIFCSSVCMSKLATKIFLKGLNVKTLNYLSVDGINIDKDILDKITYPVIVKPDTGGSSIGITVAQDQTSLKYAVSVALRYGKKAIVERYLENATEINCAVYRGDNGLVVSECEKPIFVGELLSFNDKYKDGDRVFPADIPKKLSDKIKNITKTVYDALDGEGVIRVDFLIKDGVVYVNEINTVPGSLAYYLFGERTADFTKMLNQLLKRANENSAKQSSLKTNYDSGILNGLKGKGAKRLKN